LVVVVVAIADIGVVGVGRLAHNGLDLLHAVAAANAVPEHEIVALDGLTTVFVTGKTIYAFDLDAMDVAALDLGDLF
ncbi:MAG: hypothetical protein II038_02230, partial [Lachnospiraceae bacterium]|nr:hypothetical protein [Lachnospiraceae bacterium]